jgi:hypothetical protein
VDDDPDIVEHNCVDVLSLVALVAVLGRALPSRATAMPTHWRSHELIAATATEAEM